MGWDYICFRLLSLVPVVNHLYEQPFCDFGAIISDPELLSAILAVFIEKLVDKNKIKMTLYSSNIVDAFICLPRFFTISPLTAIARDTLLTNKSLWL